MRDRGWRRAEAEKRKERVRRYIRAGWSPCSRELADDPAWVGRHARTPHPCSGPCCGNPRRYGGFKWSGPALTMQERRASA